jgi:hypothetical protein
MMMMMICSDDDKDDDSSDNDNSDNDDRDDDDDSDNGDGDADSDDHLSAIPMVDTSCRTTIVMHALINYNRSKHPIYIIPTNLSTYLGMQATSIAVYQLIDP